MKTYTFWNNKGGTGKTSLCFQTSIQYAINHPIENILIIDMCPQANLSEILLGGMLGNGSKNLESLWTRNQSRCSIAGYFYDHLPSAHMMPPNLNAHNYICQPHKYNNNIPLNVSLVAGDSYVELLTNYISAQAATVLPNTNTYISIVKWLYDFLQVLSINDEYQVVFIDTNPSFSIYTQMAIASADELIIPVTADESSIRALNNVLALVYGISPNANNIQYTFNAQMTAFGGKQLPKINSVIRNRLTQYMRQPASAYNAVLDSINTLSNKLKTQYSKHFVNNFNIFDVRDFNTAGQISFAEAKVFSQLNAGYHKIGNRQIQANQNMIHNCIDAMTPIINNL